MNSHQRRRRSRDYLGQERARHKRERAFLQRPEVNKALHRLAYLIAHQTSDGFAVNDTPRNVGGSAEEQPLRDRGLPAH